MARGFLLRTAVLIVLVSALALGVAYWVTARPPVLLKRGEPPPAPPFERYTIVDTASGLPLVVIPHPVQVGDEWLTSDNRVFRVFRVEGDRAYARLVRRERAPPLPPIPAPIRGAPRSRE